MNRTREESLNQQKHQYLLSRGLKLSKGINKFELTCEICESMLTGQLTISKYGRAYGISVAGEFHHDAERKMHLLCDECHNRIHDWGVIQRWLKKIGKRVEDLPDATGLQPMRKFRW